MHLVKHPKTYDGAISDLVRRKEQCHNHVDKRKKEIDNLKGRVLDLETRNVLLEAKVGRAQRFQLRNH